MRIVWYPALPNAEPLPFPCCISNPYWERDQYQFGDDNCDFETIVPTGKPRTKPGSGGGHVCGTEEDFRDGGLYLPDDPPELIGMQGLPACCNPAVVGRGGVIDGGKASMAAGVRVGGQCPVYPSGLELDNWYIIERGDLVSEFPFYVPAGNYRLFVDPWPMTGGGLFGARIFPRVSGTCFADFSHAVDIVSSETDCVMPSGGWDHLALVITAEMNWVPTRVKLIEVL